MFHSFIVANYRGATRKCKGIFSRGLSVESRPDAGPRRSTLDPRLIHPSVMSEPLLQIDLPGIPKIKSGKVREIFDLGDSLLMVATDRISAFDCIMPNGIPRKGEVLTQISHFWFEKFAGIVPNHLLARARDPLPDNLRQFNSLLEGRSMIVKKAKPLAIECVVRGYLSGSGWKEYQQSQTVSGIKLSEALTESSQLPEPIFTPATKAENRPRRKHSIRARGGHRRQRHC